MKVYVVDNGGQWTHREWRVLKYRHTGLLWWSLMDMWPMAFNYSVVDVHGRPKLPYDYLRLSQQPFALMGHDAGIQGI